MKWRVRGLGGMAVIAGGMAASFVVGACGEEPWECHFDGEAYVPGDTWETASSACTCNDDRTITCVAKDECKGGDCCADGTSYTVGESWPSPEEEDCGTCACLAVGTIQCFSKACASGCLYGGMTYAPGETFPSSDGCNTCSCADDGTVACTEKACG